MTESLLPKISVRTSYNLTVDLEVSQMNCYSQDPDHACHASLCLARRSNQSLYSTSPSNKVSIITRLALGNEVIEMIPPSSDSLDSRH